MHTGAHKLNNALGQVVLAQRLGKTRIIAETGAGQHGVATATVCARFGLECVVYMGSEDMRRQQPNVERMGLLGAEVRPVEFGTKTLKEATSEAIRDWITNVETTHYLIGSCVGPEPYPEIVRELQAVIGREAREQMLEAEGRLPDAAIACVGGGSNAIGMFAGFLDDADVRLVGVEAAGAASLGTGRPGVLHGARSSVLADEDGQIADAHSISAGLDYPGVGPEHAYLRDTGRVEYLAATDDEALDAFRRLAETEGIIPALEPAHALARAPELDGDVIVVCLSGPRRQGPRTRPSRPILRHVPEQRAALVIYLMAGAETPDLAAAAEAGGADLVEIGFPFSDPLADGPVIRRAAERALAAGMRTRACLECLAATRARVAGAARPDDLLVAARGVRLGALRRRRARRRRDEPDRRRPARRRAPGAPPDPARRADLDRRAHRARRRGDRRLALPRHADRDDRRARRRSPPRSPASSSARAAPPTSRSTPASGSRRPEHAARRRRARRRDRRRLARGRGRRGRPGGARALRQLAEGRR